ncbi:MULTISPECIES: endonuclease [Actinomadura]|uniref:Endonuclease n=2 Tax=Actinomadura yumaensis TaxID=111807 RepID=A0ABW2CD70_9ACTN|nr:endonuclease [Actinomadura sp. J1-007]MWK38125.1 endonuclease [Actinomadura sp. J1-007]
MDERTKATVRALLDRYPRGYVQETAGFTVTATAAGLFRLACLAILADDGAPSATAVGAARAVLSGHRDSAPEMAKVEEHDLADVLAQADLDRPEEGARDLAAATRLIMDRYGGDLNRLRDAADGDPARLRDLLGEIPGMDGAGLTVFLREAQMFWPEAGPFVDDRAARAAERLDLPSDPERLLRDVARGGGEEELSWLAGALALVDARGEYDDVRKAA